MSDIKELREKIVIVYIMYTTNNPMTITKKPRLKNYVFYSKTKVKEHTIVQGTVGPIGIG